MGCLERPRMFGRWLSCVLIAAASVSWQANAAYAQTPLADWLEAGTTAAATAGFIDTDGPSFTRASTTVPRGMVQLESRYVHSAFPVVNSLPQLDLRIGVAPNLELRAEWLGIDNGNALQSANDLEVGFKYATTRQDAWIPTS